MTVIATVIEGYHDSPVYTYMYIHMYYLNNLSPYWRVKTLRRPKRTQVESPMNFLNVVFLAYITGYVRKMYAHSSTHSMLNVLPITDAR